MLWTDFAREDSNDFKERLGDRFGAASASAAAAIPLSYIRKRHYAYSARFKVTSAMEYKQIPSDAAEAKEKEQSGKSKHKPRRKSQSAVASQARRKSQAAVTSPAENDDAGRRRASKKRRKLSSAARVEARQLDPDKLNVQQRRRSRPGSVAVNPSRSVRSVADCVTRPICFYVTITECT